MFKIAVLISGNGSNLEALIDACKKNLINGSVEIIISNNPDAYGIERAKNHLINYKIIDNNRFKTREDFDRALVEELQDSNPDLIVLAGFMRILTPVMIEAFKNKIINIHPSLLPKYPGLDTHNSVMKNGDLKHGVTIHYVNEVLDGGQIIAQGEISVNANETSEELKTRIHAIEHVMLPMIVSKFADGTINAEKIIYEKFK
jgi:phosphoribosylglycinamide formyltransferase-1